jgi:S-adenosyl-L-methionine hydrolase (adenosine-forming)
MIITLLTDFGSTDTYVGQLKGALLAVAPSAVCVDLAHSVPSQDVRTGAFHLWAAAPAFPAGTIHLAVVDPGVGSSRRAIAASALRGHIFVGPDNGLLGPAIDRLGGLVAAVELSEPRYHREKVSGTFHGRDIFAPVAGHLSQGTSLSVLGPALDALDRSVVFPEPTQRDQGLSGEVLHVDTYGNLVTNLPASALPAKFEVRVGARRVRGSAHYAAAKKGTLLALIGSNGLLEIAVREGDARRILRARVGTPVELKALG